MLFATNLSVTIKPAMPSQFFVIAVGGFTFLRRPGGNFGRPPRNISGSPHRDYSFPPFCHIRNCDAFLCPACGITPLSVASAPRPAPLLHAGSISRSEHILDVLSVDDSGLSMAIALECGQSDMAAAMAKDMISLPGLFE